MSRYKMELWLGKLESGKGWNWEIKGIPDDDYLARAKACDEYIEMLRGIKQFYKDLECERRKV